MNDRQAIRILGAGAPRIGVSRCAETFAADSGHPLEFEHATAPAIRECVMSGNAEADVIVAPRPLMDELADAGHVEPETVSTLGSVAVGVVVRNGAREPDLSSVDSFVRSFLEADAVVYNKASSGLYVAQILEKLGIADELALKTVVVPNGVSVMKYLAAHDSSNMVGFGHATEIRRHDELGTHYVGPLPGAIGRETPYAVGLTTAATRPDVARRLIEFMTSSAGRAIFAATGVA